MKYINELIVRNGVTAYSAVSDKTKVLPVMREFKMNGVTYLRRDGSIVVSERDHEMLISRQPAGLDGLPSTRRNRIKRGPRHG